MNVATSCVPWRETDDLAAGEPKRTGRAEARALAMKRCRLQIYYVGNVQGVGFRYTAKSLATGFEVTGIVRNLADGRVELVAEGVKDELIAFQQAIRESELGHFIRKEEVAWAESQGNLSGFEIGR